MSAVDDVVHARRWKTLAVLSLSLVVIGLDNTILNVALPTLQTHFHTTDSQLEWMVDSYMLVFAGLLLVAGTLGDRFGRKLALQTGLAVFGLASLAAPLAGTAHEVIVVRSAMGVGAASIMPATLSIIANLFTGAERRKAIGIWAAQAAVGIGLGPLAGGILLEWFSWWSVFMVNVPFIALALLLGVRYVPETRDPRPGSFDLAGAVLETVGSTVLVYGIIEAPGDGWTSATVLGSLAAAVVLLAAFVALERRRAQPMLDVRLFAKPAFGAGTGSIGIAFFGLLGSAFALTQYLQFAHGYSAIQAGAVMSPMTLGLVLGAASASRLAERLGLGRVVAAGLVVVAAMLVLPVLWSRDTSPIALGAWFFGLTVGLGWISAPATDAVVGAVPPARSGVASATNTVVRMVGGALGVAVIGSLITSLYTNDVDGSLGAYPPPARAGASDSIGAAHAIAAHLPQPAGTRLAHTTGDAFTNAMGRGMLVGAALAALAAALAIRLLPGREQHDDVVAETAFRMLVEPDRAA